MQRAEIPSECNAVDAKAVELNLNQKLKRKKKKNSFLLKILARTFVIGSMHYSGAHCMLLITFSGSADWILRTYLNRKRDFYPKPYSISDVLFMYGRS